MYSYIHYYSAVVALQVNQQIATYGRLIPISFSVLHPFYFVYLL